MSYRLITFQPNHFFVRTAEVKHKHVSSYECERLKSLSVWI